MKNKFAEQLNSLRLESGLSRSQLAEKLNVSTRLVSYWENGQRECDFDMLIKIAEIFSTSVDYLLGRRDY
ncbi:MAG: helix-turn-helix transcriptional regulator [Clostridiales bacterium]|nr:helix-turn-helix transcriptional regulator [Clostridiales bacterium]